MIVTANKDFFYLIEIENANNSEPINNYPASNIFFLGNFLTTKNAHIALSPEKIPTSYEAVLAVTTPSVPVLI